MSAALTRRAALRGSAAAALGLVGSACSPAKGHAASDHPDHIGVVADAALIALAGRIEALAPRRRAATERIDRLELQVADTHPRPPRGATTDEYRAYWVEIRPTEERIGLTRLRSARRRTTERLDRWAGDLAAMRPSTSAGLGAKASAVLAIDDLCGDDEGAERLMLSVLQDAVRLGGGADA